MLYRWSVYLRVACAAVAMFALTAATASIASADPLAVHVADATGATRPTSPERLALADAVAAALSRELPEVLSGTETRSRLEVLDPAQISCGAPQCSAQTAALLRARGVVIVRPTLSGTSLRLELVAVNLAGETTATQQEETTIADWEDAIALGRVAGGRLAVTLRAAAARTAASNATAASSTVGGSGATVVSDPALRGPGGPTVTRSAPRFALVGVGLAAIVGGAVAIVIPAITLAGGSQCTANCNPTVNPSPLAMYTDPSPLNYAWIGIGAIAVIGGTIALIVGATNTETVPAATAASMSRRIARALSFGATPSGGAVFLHGSF